MLVPVDRPSRAARDSFVAIGFRLCDGAQPIRSAAPEAYSVDRHEFGNSHSYGGGVLFAQNCRSIVLIVECLSEIAH